MVQKLVFVIVAILLCSTTGNTAGSSIFSDSSDTRAALQFIGAPPNVHHIQGSIVTSGEYYEFSEQLLAIWVKKDSARFKSLLTQSTVDLYTTAGEAIALEQWGKRHDRTSSQVYAR